MKADALSVCSVQVVLISSPPTHTHTLFQPSAIGRNLTEQAHRAAPGARQVTGHSTDMWGTLAKWLELKQRVLSDSGQKLVTFYTGCLWLTACSRADMDLLWFPSR